MTFMRISVASLNYCYSLTEQGTASLLLPVFVGQYGLTCKIMECKSMVNICCCFLKFQAQYQFGQNIKHREFYSFQTLFRVLKKKTMDVHLSGSFKKIFRSSIAKNQNLHPSNIESFFLIKEPFF